MLKKARAEQAGEAAGGKDESRGVLESSRQIWLAGLGAFSRAQAEGMKVFDALVRQGEAVEAKTREAASHTAAAARSAAHAKAKEMQQMAGGTWDKLEKVFEDRVARALSRLGVHTQSDVDRLAERVDALSEAVNELIKASGGTPVRRATRSPREHLRKEAVSPAARTATSSARGATDVVSSAARTASSAAPTASGAVTTARKAAKRTARLAKKGARAALK
jgi:poly(hydroxyalkanoate) granule-associated protein